MIIKQIVYIIIIFIFITCNAYAATQLANIDFEGNLTDSLGFATSMSGAGGTFVPGHTGYSYRSSHNMDDGSDQDFLISLPSGYFSTHNELYIKFYYKFESEYINTSHNVKFLRTQETGEADTHNEIACDELTSSRVHFLWQITDFGGWGDGKVTKYGGVNVTQGTWMKVEIYFKLSTGEDHENTDGIQWIKINDSYAIYQTTVRTGTPGYVSSPNINATADQATGHGWWQIDDYEVWDGIPASSPTPPKPIVNTPEGFQAVPTPQ